MMSTHSRPSNIFRRPAFIGWLVFLILFATVMILSYQRYRLFKEARKTVLSNAALNAKDKIKTVLDHSGAAIRTLGFIITQEKSNINFDTVAQRLMASHPYVDALELVEGGTITNVYPLTENAAAIGYDILKDPKINKEAKRAIKEKQLFYAGPFLLKQGYVAVVGRLPLYFNNKFWGFSAAIVKLSTLIRAAELDSGSNKDYIFQLSKVDPNTGREQFFLPHNGEWGESDWESVAIAEGDWKIYARFVDRRLATALLPFMILGFLFAASGGLFAWYGARQPYRLQRLVSEKTAQLKASEERYFSFFEKASDTIIVINPAGVITEVNTSVCKLLGFGREELIGRRFSSLLDPVQAASDPLDAMFRHQEKELVQEIRLGKKDGGFVEVELNVKKIDGDHTLAIGRDLTGLREAQKKVAVSESTLRGAFEHSAIGMALVSPEGQWLRVNKALCQMLGYQPEEIEAMGFEDVTHPADREEAIRFMKEAVSKDASVYQTEKRYICKGGAVIWVNLSASAIRDHDGRLLYFVTQTEDITEKKKTAELLQVREQQLRLFVEYSPAALAMFDKDMRYLMTSRRWLTDYGLEGKQVIGQVHYDLFPDNPQRWRDIHSQCMNGQSARSEEDFFIDENGKTIWLRWEVHPWRHYNGDIGGIILFTEVITRLKEAEIKFRKLVERSPVGVCIIQDGRFSYVNPEFANIFGYAEQDMTAIISAPEILAEDSRHIFKWLDLTSDPDEALFMPQEAIGRRKDGQQIFLEVYGTVATYEGRPALMCTLMDVTERKKAEHTIRESEEKFRTLIEKSLAGVYILQDGKVVYINPAHQKIMGYSLQELQSIEDVESLVHEADVQSFRSYHQPGSGMEGHQNQYVLRAIRKDGGLVYLEITTSQIIYEGSPAWIGTMLDITDRIEEEMRIGRAVNDAQERERMQIGMELHDNVKQIMAASLLTIDFVKGNLSDVITATQSLDNLKKYTMQAIDELRRLSHRLAPAMDANDSFQDQIESLVGTMNTDDTLKMDIHVTDQEISIPMEIRTAFYRIVQEQLNNILKYAKASNVSIRVEANKKGFTLLIRDDGQGFDSSLRSEGIGLANIRRRAFVLRGTADISSRPGKGCQVVVFIPVQS